MKKFALAAAALVLSAGAAFAGNPNVGTPANLYANDHTPVASQRLDYTATASISSASSSRMNSAGQDVNGSAHRFGDASPSSYEN